jgi:hypothetical protein
MTLKHQAQKILFFGKILFNTKDKARLRLLFELDNKLKKYEQIVFMQPDNGSLDKALVYKNPEKAYTELTSYLWAVPTIPTPFVGEAPAPGKYGKSTINSQQFRHPTDIHQPKPRGTYRIFFTGGSTAFCSGAPSDETTITSYLQAMLDQKLTPQTGVKFEVINAACPGWTSTHERLWIELKIPEMEPDMVIEFSGNNEAHWGVRHYSAKWMRNYGEQLFWRMVSSWYEYFEKKPLLDNVPREIAKVAPDSVAQALTRNIRCCMLFLGEMKVSYVFILHPILAESKKRLTQREQSLREKDAENAYFQQCYNAIRLNLAKIESNISQTESKYVKLFDYSYIFDNLNDDVFLDSCHFGDKGNELIAAKIFEDISPILIDRTRADRQNVFFEKAYLLRNA